MQKLTIFGTVGKDAELRHTQGGDSVLSFSLACDNGKDKNGNKRDATWYDCSIWGKRAESLQRHIVKGSKLVLTGIPQARAHNDKAYLGIRVDDLAFAGGGQRDEGEREYRHADPARQAPASGYGAGGYAMDDEVPFAPCMI